MSEIKDIVLRGGGRTGMTYAVVNAVQQITIQGAVFIKTADSMTIKGRKFEVFQFQEEQHASKEESHPDPTYIRRRPRVKGGK